MKTYIIEDIKIAGILKAIKYLYQRSNRGYDDRLADGFCGCDICIPNKS